MVRYRMWLALGSAILAVLAVGSGAHAGMAVIGASKDNTLYEDPLGERSNGAGDHFFAGTSGAPHIRRGLLAFDIAGAVPSGATITSVALTLNMSRTVGPATNVTLHHLLNDWGEGASDAPGNEGGGAPSEAGDATWVHTFFDTHAWDTSGGDFDPVASAQILVATVDLYTWQTTDALVADVQSWLDNPAENYGWLLMGDEANAFTAKRFDSRQNPNESLRPMLEITYVPAPGAAGLLLAAGFRRRRRG